MKILVIGAPLSGKTTLANELSHTYNIQVFHTDNLVFMLSKMGNLSTKSLESEIEKIMSEKDWIIEGRHIFSEVIAKSDEVKWIKIPFWKACEREIEDVLVHKENITNVFSWIKGQITDQYFGNADESRLNDPLYSHNKKIEKLLEPYKSKTTILDS